MLIKSRWFNDFEISESEIIYFSEGLYGFENIKEFVLLGNPDNLGNPFKWLHAVDNKNVCFVVVDPKVIKNNYYFINNCDIINKLKAESEADLVAFCIVVIPNDIDKMTVNLKSPVIINKKKNKGMQLILDNEDYKIKHEILNEVKKGA